MEYVNSIEFIAHLKCASCKCILECYGITKDVTIDEFVMVLPFAEHGDLRAFLKVNETTLTWGMFLDILFQIAGDLRFIHDSKLLSFLILDSDVLPIILPGLICKGASHTKYSDIYSFAIISCEIISGERPLHNTAYIYVRFDEMIEKNWHCDPQYRDTAEELQKTVIATRDNCNLNQPIH
ncbi:hypothetical protein G9A89_007551 [Geosiphon pyriformis]|nr:hypothetical protein G9A89_007551 [Geosiphon pyriformis]